MSLTPAPHSHCSWCGAPFDPDALWPRICAGCGNTSFLNPVPVAVVAIPIDTQEGTGVLAIRRAIPPGQGMPALPGGYVNLGETWREAAAREVLEETGLVLAAGEIHETRVESAPDGTLIIVARATPRRVSDLPPFMPNEECSERLVLTEPEPMAFRLHEEVLRDLLKNNTSGRDAPA